MNKLYVSCSLRQKSDLLRQRKETARSEDSERDEAERVGWGGGQRVARKGGRGGGGGGARMG